MTDDTAHRTDSRPLTSAVGARLPARLRRRRALLVPPPVMVQHTAA